MGMMSRKRVSTNRKNPPDRRFLLTRFAGLAGAAAAVGEDTRSSLSLEGRERPSPGAVGRAEEGRMGRMAGADGQPLVTPA